MTFQSFQTNLGGPKRRLKQKMVLRDYETESAFLSYHSSSQAHIRDAVYFRGADFARRVAGGYEDEVVEHRARGRAGIIGAQYTEAALRVGELCVVLPHALKILRTCVDKLPMLEFRKTRISHYEYSLILSMA